MKTIKSFAKFWNSPIFRISKVWISAKTATVILGNPEIFKYPVQCRPLGGGGGGGEKWIFSGIAYSLRLFFEKK